MGTQPRPAPSCPLKSSPALPTAQPQGERYGKSSDFSGAQERENPAPHLIFPNPEVGDKENTTELANTPPPHSLMQTFRPSSIQPLVPLSRDADI